MRTHHAVALLLLPRAPIGACWGTALLLHQQPPLPLLDNRRSSCVRCAVCIVAPSHPPPKPRPCCLDRPTPAGHCATTLPQQPYPTSGQLVIQSRWWLPLPSYVQLSCSGVPGNIDRSCLCLFLPCSAAAAAAAATSLPLLHLGSLLVPRCIWPCSTPAAVSAEAVGESSISNAIHLSHDSLLHQALATSVQLVAAHTTLTAAWLGGGGALCLPASLAAGLQCGQRRLPGGTPGCSGCAVLWCRASVTRRGCCSVAACCCCCCCCCTITLPVRPLPLDHSVVPGSLAQAGGHGAAVVPHLPRCCCCLAALLPLQWARTWRWWRAWRWGRGCWPGWRCCWWSASRSSNPPCS